MLREATFDVSFSGLKTAVARWVEARQAAGEPVPVADVCASFQEAVVDVLTAKAVRACTEHGIGSLLLGGGVAANSRLRALAEERCAAPASSCASRARACAPTTARWWPRSAAGWSRPASRRARSTCRRQLDGRPRGGVPLTAVLLLLRRPACSSRARSCSSSTSPPPPGGSGSACWRWPSCWPAPSRRSW
jgi:hypothetical protein